MTYTTFRVAATVLAMLTTVTVPTTARAQTATTATKRGSAAIRANSTEPTGSDRMRGFMLGVHSIAAPGLTLTGEEIGGSFSTKFGAGAGMTVGYGITRLFSAFASLDVAKQNTAPDVEPAGSWGLSHFEVGGRANIPLGASSTVPYISASVGRRAMAARTTNEDGEQFDSAITGPMIGLGGGIEHFFSRSMALDAGIGVGYGKFTNVKFGEEEYDPKANATTSIRLHLGVNWRPGGRRS
jgi:hypothetical protein